MVRWCPDNKGRFHKRPFYQVEELDAECERLLAGSAGQLAASRMWRSKLMTSW